MTADWSRKFDEPIALPKGRMLVTLKDAGTYITKLPKAEHMATEWQAAMEALILVATLGGPTMFARIGIMRALNRHVERVFDPSRKNKHWGRPVAGAGSMTEGRNCCQPPNASSRKCASAIRASALCVMVMNQTRLKNSDHAVFQ